MRILLYFGMEFDNKHPDQSLCNFISFLLNETLFGYHLLIRRHA